MKKIHFSKILLLLCCSFLGFNARAQDESNTYEKMLGELFAVNGSHETFHTVIDQMFDMYKQKLFRS